MNDNLFLDSVGKRRSNRLYGDIILYSSVSIKLVVSSIVVFVTLAIFGVVLATYARTESVKGTIVPINGASKVFAMRPGVVTELYVKDGDIVKTGQNIATIAMEAPDVSGEVASIEASKSIREQHDLAREQMGLYNQRSKTDIARLDEVIDGLQKQELSLDEQVNLQQEVVLSTSRTFKQLTSIVEKGFVSKLEYERRRQAAIAAEQELIRLKQQRSSVLSERARSTFERQTVNIDLKNQQIAARSSLETLRQQQSRAAGEAGYRIQASVAGRVTAFQSSVGQTVGAAVPLMIIVPEGQSLKADLYVPSRAIGFIKRGQEVRLLYDSFPYRKFGSFGARIVSISRIAISPGESNAPFKIDEPVYKVSAVPTDQSVVAYGQKIGLQPGMTLVANIVLERQSFLKWLLSPIQAVANRD